MVKLQTIAGDSWITCIGKCHEMQAAWKLQSFQDLVHMPGANTTVQSDCIDAGVLLGILEQSFGTQSRGAVAKLVDGKGYNEKAVKIRFDFGKNRCQLFHIRKCFKIQDGNSIFQKQLCNFEVFCFGFLWIQEEAVGIGPISPAIKRGDSEF